ncbi:MAG: hypothetical protein ABI721_00810 [Candidatus Dojkabacteria bacterium]
MDLLQLKQYVDAVKNIGYLRKNIKEIPLDSPQAKLSSIFVDIVFNPSRMKYVADLVGIDEFVYITNSTSVEELSDRIFGLSLFNKNIEENFRLLKALVDAWNICIKDGALDLNKFLIISIDALTEIENFIDTRSHIEVDWERRKELYIKYGVEF